MARKIRVQYPGAIYHVMNRGDHQEKIFRSSKDRELFLETLGQACEKADWQIHAWCLMSNHLHLVVETPRANLVDGMKWLLGTYTARTDMASMAEGFCFNPQVVMALPARGLQSPSKLGPEGRCLRRTRLKILLLAPRDRRVLKCSHNMAANRKQTESRSLPASAVL